MEETGLEQYEQGLHFEYPNHYLMKKNRIIKLKQVNGLCEICKNQAKVIHHIDGSNDNHDVENLIAVCFSCHKVLHSDHDEKRPSSTNKNHNIYTRTYSKYKRQYGMTLDEMQEKYGYNTSYLCHLHQKNKLADFLKKIQK